MPHLPLTHWLLAALAAMGIGISKAGFPGVGLFHVLVFAFLFGARDSTGVVLPMLLVGDLCGVSAFRRHTRWDYVRRMLPPAFTGIILGAAVMGRLSETVYKPLIGVIILVLTGLQVVRLRNPNAFGNVPHSLAFTWSLGLLAGMTTMFANAAGPIFALYLLAVGLPKYELVGTGAWFFFLVNVFKVPFSLWLGLIHGQTILLNIVLIPAIVTGNMLGRAMTARVPQRLFDAVLLTFAVVAALRLIGVF